MSQHKQPEQSAQQWFAKIRGGLTAEETRAFQAWLESDEQHLDAYERQQLLWNLAGELKQDADLQALARQTQANVQQLAAQRKGRQRRRTLFSALAASILVAAVLVGQQLWMPAPVSNSETYFTAVGEQEKIQLADGSTIALNTDSLVEVNYSEAERRIKLVKGEAFFTVAKDSQRPFRVYAGPGVTTAIGTAFNVFYSGKQAEVAVLEGRVSVGLLPARQATPSTAMETASTLPQLGAGEQITYSDKQLGEVKVGNLQRVQAWQTGKLNFDAQPLAEVIQDYNRYSATNLTLADRQLASLPVSGIFNIGDEKALLFALQTTFGIQHKQYGQVIVLSAGQTPAASDPPNRR